MRYFLAGCALPFSILAYSAMLLLMPQSSVKLARAAPDTRMETGCYTWNFNNWSDFTGYHVVIEDGNASLERSREIGAEWEDVSLPYTAVESEVTQLESFSDGCLYATTVEPVSGPDYGKVCKSCDGGMTWNCVNLDIPGVRHSMKVRDIYEASDGTIYAASYDTSATPNNSGIWKSTDGGATWTLMHALIGSGCTGVVETSDGSIIASTKGWGSVWRCADPVGNPTVWTEVFQTPTIPWYGAPATYPPYPPPVVPACDYLWDNYHEHCGGLPYNSYPSPYRPDRTQALCRASDGTLFVSTNTGSGSIWSGGQALRSFGHIYMSTDNGVTWQDGGAFNPPPVSEIYYWGFWNGSTWVQHHHQNGSSAADPWPTMQSFPTWVDNIWEDSQGNIYACSSSGDPLRSWILNPRRDGIVFRYDPAGGVWNALGNLPGTGNFPGTDTYSQNNALYCHDIDEDSVSNHLYTVSSWQALVHRSADGGATWDWFMSPRTLFGKAASGDLYSIEITCDSCLYVGYMSYGEVYASRAAYHDDGWIQNVAGFSYSGGLTGFTETVAPGSLGTITYWISNGGSSWYWWNGAGWAAATNPAESNPASVIHANIGSFFPSGTFHFRAFLHPATVQGCPKTPHLVSLEVCAATPTPTPTVAPTATPCLCAKPVIEASPGTVSPGVTLAIECCIPVMDDPVDIYCVVITPNGDYWSIVPGGYVKSGPHPFARGYLNLNCWCGQLKHQTICGNAIRGKYIVALAILPAGAKPVINNVLMMDWTYVMVTS